MALLTASFVIYLLVGIVLIHDHRNNRSGYALSTDSARFEAESGTLSGPVSAGADSNASSGHYAQVNTSSTAVLSHIMGGFSIDTPTIVTNAAGDGAQIDMEYGTGYSPSDPTGQALNAHNMKEMEGQIWTY